MHRSWPKNAFNVVAQVSCEADVTDFDADMRMIRVLPSD
jgi:hypothetical protein